MTKWLAKLQGSILDLQELEKILSSHDPMLVCEKGTFYLRSRDWDQLQDEQEVYNQAKRFVEKLDRAAFIHFRDSSPLVVRLITGIDEDGSIREFAFIEGSVNAHARARGSLSAIGPNCQPIETEQEPTIIKTLRAAEQHQEVADALRLFRKGDWRSLSNAFEIVEDHPLNNQGIIGCGWLTKASMGRFTQTVQSSAAIGDEARHAKRKFKSPDPPMSIHEARALIGDLIQKWIEAKYTETMNT